MIRQIQASANTELDQVLEFLCEALQPTPSEWDDAVQKYEAAGTWLGDVGSPLYRFQPDIKYQGSALLGTVVRRNRSKRRVVASWRRVPVSSWSDGVATRRKDPYPRGKGVARPIEGRRVVVSHT